ncbi:hypothetical protein E3T26_08620 [Cryobacterium sp. TMT1-21]|uniref:hypothetical protein n=1 Tax=Cryobacterium sp. TMT1-21 TaxID=1259234 RepID=UPI00106BD3CB|nr:hypothetical protein [Cryobacterium sp. TMT1-21]TFD14177.1 hypothetical protein E3T26_08620 [Cryobacterium sp. TMT1-21]
MARLPKYEVELWTKQGSRIADITWLCKNIAFTEERNEAEDLRFSLDLDAFEGYMLKAGADPVSNFREGQTEIKIKKDGQYLFGTQLFDAPISLNQDNELTIDVVATGYLNFLKDRYPNPVIKYTNIETVEIFYDLIRQAQAVANGSYGLIIPTSGYYVTGVLRNREYEYYTSSTKLNMQRLTSLVDGNFDFKVLADKTVMTYESVGSPRTDFKLVFDRKNNRSSFSKAKLNRSSNGLYNSVIGLGSGFGGDMMLSTQNDLPSQIEFGLRQLPAQFNEVSVQGTLNENALARLGQVKKLLRLPQITLSGSDMPANGIEIGDLIPLQFTGRKLIEDMTGVYRVERKETTLDENGFESSITLYFEQMDAA